MPENVTYVVHGQWITDECDPGEPNGYPAFIEVHCSMCGCTIGIESGQYGWFYGDPFPMRYCPECGKKMDKEYKRNSEDYNGK